MENLYVPTIWKDHEVDEHGTVVQQGTSLNADHFNHMEVGILDAQIFAAMVMNFARQQGWRIDDIYAYLASHNVVETGTASLTNTETFPFNNSKKSVALVHTQQSVNYVVITSIASFVGNVGEVEVTDRLVNGFKLAYTGSAKSATINYIVIGGFNE